MKKLLVLLVFWGMAMGVEGQKEDYVWLSGYDSQVGYDIGWGFYFGTSVLDFNYSPRIVRYDSLKMNFHKTNTSYCDSSGKLLFYTNGIYIANGLDEKIENSDSLNTGILTDWIYPSMQTYGYRNYQGIFAIPKEDNLNQYYLFHSWRDTFGIYERGKKVLVTLLDMSMNGGHGKVIYKNQSVITDTLGTALALTKHGNGRDWWLVVPERNTNCYYRILIDETGIHALPGKSCGSEVIYLPDEGPACFSPDGTKYIYLSSTTGLHIFDFDRCNGELNNPLYLPLPIIDSAGWHGMGVVVSPNNRFLYVSLTLHLYQFDLWATDVLNSIDTVGIYDGFQGTFASLFHTAQNGPDGKIYISCGNSDTVYHVINHPDLKGDSCDLVQHGIHLSRPSLGVPSFPNYRLGALSGSPCDTLTGLNETARAAKEKEIKVFPNPAADYVTVDYGFTDWSRSGDLRLVMSDELGRVAYEQALPRYSGLQKIDVSGFGSGVYRVIIKRGGVVVAASKFARE